MPSHRLTSDIGAAPACFINAFRRRRRDLAERSRWTPGSGECMDHFQFEAFMAAQVAAIEASGVNPETWVERHSATFRAAWEAGHAAC